MFYIDEYVILDLTYVVHAFPLNPSAEHVTDPEEWLICVLLHVGKKAYRETLGYPTRVLRDDAFAAICDRLRAATVAPGRSVLAEDEDAF